MEHREFYDTKFLFVSNLKLHTKETHFVERQCKKGDEPAFHSAMLCIPYLDSVRFDVLFSQF